MLCGGLLALRKTMWLLPLHTDAISRISSNVQWVNALGVYSSKWSSPWDLAHAHLSHSYKGSSGLWRADTAVTTVFFLFFIFFREGITKCSNEVYNKINNIRQHNKYLLEYIGYMFQPVNRSSSTILHQRDLTWHDTIIPHTGQPQYFYTHWM